LTEDILLSHQAVGPFECLQFKIVVNSETQPAVVWIPMDVLSNCDDITALHIDHERARLAVFASQDGPHLDVALFFAIQMNSPDHGFVF
jgi:hypothetical protein